MFITHFIDEIMNFSDDVTVLRSGRHVVTDDTAKFTPETVVRAMIGTKLESFFPKQEAKIGDTVLSVRGSQRRRLRRAMSISTSAPARSSASSGWSAPADPKSPACCSAW